MTMRIEELYEQDVYAWTRAPAALRRLGWLLRPNLDSRAPDPRGRCDSIIDACAVLDGEPSPSLCGDLEQHLPRLRGQTRNIADSGFGRFAEPDADLLPADLPNPLDNLLTDAWRPANRRGLPHDR